MILSLKSSGVTQLPDGTLAIQAMTEQMYSCPAIISDVKAVKIPSKKVIRTITELICPAVLIPKVLFAKNRNFRQNHKNFVAARRRIFGSRSKFLVKKIFWPKIEILIENKIYKIKILLKIKIWLNEILMKY